MMNSPLILIIDDEPQIRKLLKICLESNGFRTIEASNGKEGTLLAASHMPDLILLDIGLPDKCGHDVLLEFRDWYVKPIIILSVQDSERDIVTAIDNGAIDYLTKPFRTGELIARIKSALRISNSDARESIVNTGNLQIDLISRTVKRSNQTVKLTHTEYKLLALFARNQGRVLTHQNILKEIWGTGYQNETQYLRVFVGQLRKKLEEDPTHPGYIITESGVGYRFQ